jgi:putative endonuclease
MTTKTTGNYGEDLAVRYIQHKGYVIIDRNYDCPFGEIDIVAQKGPDIIFYEVKYRTNTSFGRGDEAISPGKIKKLKKSIESWISKKGRNYRYHNIYLNAIIIDANKEIEEFEVL